MAHPKVEAAFLLLLNHGSELLHELKRGDVRIEGALKMKLDGFAAAHSVAMDSAKFARQPATDVLPPASVFDGGPISAGMEIPTAPAAEIPKQQLNVEEQHRADIQAGVDLANANQPLPDDASPSVRQGYHAIKPPQIPDPEDTLQPFNSDPEPEPEAPPVAPMAAATPGGGDGNAGEALASS